MEEPKRKSFLDVLNGHLNLADRFALVTRFVYIGDYKGSKEDLKKKIKMSVKELNEEFDETVLTGLLLIYPTSFLHLIEASEEIIYRHLQSLFVDESDGTLGRIISLPAYHNIYKLYFSEWYIAYVDKPPVLLDNIEKTRADEIQTQLKNCLFKMYSLSEYLMDMRNNSNYKFYETLKTLDKLVPEYLPEITIVEYLLSVQSLVLEDLRHYFEKSNEIPVINLYNDRIWPPHGNFVPHLVKAIDIIYKEGEDDH